MLGTKERRTGHMSATSPRQMRYSCCSRKSEAVAIGVDRPTTTKILVKGQVVRLSSDDGDGDEHNDEIDQ